MTITLARNFRLYLGEVFRVKRENRANSDFRDLLGYFTHWHKSLTASPMVEERPWITFKAIEFLERVLKPEFRVCEYGVGGSTLFLAKRVGELVSIEHDDSWGRAAEAKIRERGFRSWIFHLVPPVPHSFESQPSFADPDAYASSLPQYKDMWFKDYAAQINAYPDHHFDLVQVDGRVRHSCAKHSISKVKPGGYLIVDDTHRERYEFVHREMKRLGWQKFDFYGPGPYEWQFRQTCGWQKPG